MNAAKHAPKTHRFVVGLIHAIAVAMATDAARATESGCMATPEAAAVAFVQASARTPQDSIPFLTPKSLASFRARLAQLLDDRYAPDSVELRRRLRLEGLASEAATRMSDAEFVGAYFAAGSENAAPITVTDVEVATRQTDPYLGEAVKVRYRVSAQGRESTQERSYWLSETQGCWRLDVPLEARARLEQLSRFLKESRVDPQFTVRKSSEVALRVAPASGSEAPLSTRFSASTHSPVWVANAPLLTEKDLEGVSAYWDCDPSERAPEDPALHLRFKQTAAAKLASWSAQNVGAMLAVVLDGEVVTYAKVNGKLGNRLSICLPGRTLEHVREVAQRLAGS